MSQKIEESISAFFPAYNDEATIKDIVIKTDEILNKITDDYEIIVVDDGSTDNTGKILDELTKEKSKFRVIHHPENMGYGGALKTGFANCSKDLIFYTDGDGQYDVNELLNLLPLMHGNIDVVNGFKIKRADPMYRSILGRLYHFGAKISFGLDLEDVDCDFRLIRRKVFDKVKLEANSGVICVELMTKIQKQGFKVKEIGVHHYPRVHGQSQFFKISNLGKVFKNFALLWWELIVKKKY